MKLIREFGPTSPRFSIVPPGSTSDAWGKIKRGCVISHIPYALKGQKLLAQGIALGNVGKKQSRPERAKAFNFKAFALSGRLCCIYSKTQGDALG